MASLSSIERQYLSLVSSGVVSSSGGAIDLPQIAESAADQLRVDGAERKRLQRLLGSWKDPVGQARRFLAELGIELAAKQLGIHERALLQRLAGLEHAVAGALSGRPGDEEAQLAACLTAVGWNESFVRLSKAYEGIEGDYQHTREYLNPGGLAMIRRLTEIAGVRPGQRVLNLCAGEGGESRYLAKLGAFVTAVDISDVGCAVAERLNREQGLDARIDVVCNDIARIDPQEHGYDVIFFPDADGIHYQEDRVELFRRLRHQLNDDGVLVGSLYIPGEGAPEAIKQAFDDSMEWFGFRPHGVNADTYKKQLEDAGFEVEIRRVHEGVDISKIYFDWQQRTLEYRKRDPEFSPADCWEKKWLDLAAQSPNGFGFIVIAKPRVH